MPASVLLDDVEIRPVVPADAGELYVLQRACWVQEQHDNPGVRVPALHESLDELRAWIARDTVLVARSGGRLVGAVRASLDGESWEVGRLMVAPDLAGRGLGRTLLERIEALVPTGATTYALFTGAGSLRNQRIYKKAGYRLRGEIAPGVVRMTKPVRIGRA
ncbi:MULTISPECIES: GNAT family N-acetyltransferase [Nocardioides]|uniref:GNAT family N-acetyltransferase n=1 Tax=Nocardioides TaxID=1839 RepID=UPI002867C897|nr:GNAT family N-acetyltransferase [Nocardioides sp. CGMCC 1.13656]